MIDVLLCKDTRHFVSRNHYPGSQSFTFVFPAQIYCVELLQEGEEGDAIKAAIKRLVDYYGKHPFEREKDEKNNELSNVAMAAKTLGLKETLVEYIIENEIQKPTGMAVGAEEKEAAPKKSVRFYVVVDGISKRLLDFLIDEKTLEVLKVDQDDICSDGYDGYRYKFNLGSSEWERLVRVGNDNSFSRVAVDADDVMRMIKQKGKCKKLLSSPKIVFDGTYEIAVTCYYPATDANNFLASNPFWKGGSRYMTSLIEEWISSGTKAGAVIAKGIAETKAKVKAPEVFKYKQIKFEIKKRLQEAYPALASEVELSSRFTNMLSSYVWVIQQKSRAKNDDSDISVDKMAETFALADFRVAVYTFLEFLLLRCFNKNYKFANKDKYRDELEAYGDDDKIYLYDLVTESGGFISSGLKPNEEPYVRGEAVKWLFEQKKPKDQADLNLLLAGNLLEAKYDTDHPFNKIKVDCPSFIAMIVKQREARNNFKHGNLSYVTFEYGDPYFWMVKAFNAIMGEPDNPKKVPYAKDFIGSKEMEEEFDKAYYAAKGELDNEKFPVSNPDAYNQLIYESTSYRFEDNEYESKLSNLYDELLLQLIVGLTGSCAIDEKVRNSIAGADSFSPKKAVTDANIFLHRRNIVESGVAFDAGKFGKFIKNLREKTVKELSVREKLLYYILCLKEYKNTAWDEEFRTKLLLLIDNTLSVLDGRGHNNETRWDTDDDKQVRKKQHEAALEIYKFFTTEIKQYEVKKQL